MNLFLSLLRLILSVRLQEGKNAAEDEDDLDDQLEDRADAGKPLTTTFELNDTLYAEAELEDTDTVYLWLGVSCHVPQCTLPLTRSLPAMPIRQTSCSRIRSQLPSHYSARN